jgi:hypothetical protein
MTPEQLLEVFERFRRVTSDPQFSDGIPIIHAWMELRSSKSVSQTDLDELLRRFAAADDAGSHLHDLWKHVVDWGAKLGLSVPTLTPWARP